MLTLKIIHTDLDGGRTTHLFSGERISHTEIEYSDHQKEFTSEEDFIIVGKLSGSSGTQPFIVSEVTIFDGNDTQSIYILPKSECFIMANGKTVDAFSSYYK